MTVTLLGDSLTAGNLGIPYSRYLNLASDWRIINRGKDGDTVRGVRERTDDSMRSDGPDVVVIQTGANDVLLPEMAARGGVWTDFVENMVSAGSIPTPDPGDFSKIYADMLERLSAWGTGRIVCVTIPPLGEDLTTERNRRRREFNLRIRSAAADGGALLADIASDFERALGNLQIISEWFFEKPADFIADIRTLRKDRGARLLSESRGLYLTMDGAHLNELGASIAGGRIGELIQISL